MYLIKRDAVSLFLPQGKVKIYEYTWLPSHTRHCQKGPFLSTTIQNTEVNYMTGEQEVDERREARTQNLMYQRDVNLTNFFEDSSNKSTYESLEMHHLGISSTSPWSLPMYRIPYSKKCPPHGQSSACVPKGSKWESLQRDNENMQKGSPTLWDWKRKAHKVEP